MCDVIQVQGLKLIFCQNFVCVNDPGQCLLSGVSYGGVINYNIIHHEGPKYDPGTCLVTSFL